MAWVLSTMVVSDNIQMVRTARRINEIPDTPTIAETTKLPATAAGSQSTSSTVRTEERYTESPASFLRLSNLKFAVVNQSESD